MYMIYQGERWSMDIKKPTKRPYDQCIDDLPVPAPCQKNGTATRGPLRLLRLLRLSRLVRLLREMPELL